MQTLTDGFDARTWNARVEPAAKLRRDLILGRLPYAYCKLLVQVPIRLASHEHVPKRFDCFWDHGWGGICISAEVRFNSIAQQ